MLVTVPRVSRSSEHFPDGFDLHLLPGSKTLSADPHTRKERMLLERRERMHTTLFSVDSEETRQVSRMKNCKMPRPPLLGTGRACVRARRFTCGVASSVGVFSVRISLYLFLSRSLSHSLSLLLALSLSFTHTLSLSLALSPSLAHSLYLTV